MIIQCANDMLVLKLTLLGAFNWKSKQSCHMSQNRVVIICHYMITGLLSKAQLCCNREGGKETPKQLVLTLKKGLKIHFVLRNASLDLFLLRTEINENVVETRIASKETTTVKMAFYKKF